MGNELKSNEENNVENSVNDNDRLQGYREMLATLRRLDRVLASVPENRREIVFAEVSQIMDALRSEKK